jgi:GDP-L-fucose synthase
LREFDGAMAINVGSGEEVSIKSLAERVAKAVGYVGQIVLNLERPNGTPRKLLDCTLISGIGWKPLIDLENGIASTYEWYLNNYHEDIQR